MLVTKNQLTPLSSPKGHATLTLTILDGHFSDQVDEKQGGKIKQFILDKHFWLTLFFPLNSFAVSTGRRVCQNRNVCNRQNIASANNVCNGQTRFGLGHTSLHYNSLLDAVGGVDACCKPGGLTFQQMHNNRKYFTILTYDISYMWITLKSAYFPVW